MGHALDCLPHRHAVAAPGEWWRDGSFATECGYCTRNHILGLYRDGQQLVAEVPESNVVHDGDGGDEKEETWLRPNHLEEIADGVVSGEARRGASLSSCPQCHYLEWRSRPLDRDFSYLPVSSWQAIVHSRHAWYRLWVERQV